MALLSSFKLFCFLTFVAFLGEAASAPNLVLIIVDDLGHGDVGFNGAEYPTPNIDSLVGSGVRLTNYHVEPTCSPSRTAFLTGRFPFRTGMQSIQTIVPGSKVHLPLDTPTIAELLHQNGYHTSMVGKWHVGYSSWDYTPMKRGFDEFVGFFQASQHYYTHSCPGTLRKHEIGYDFWRGEQVWNTTGEYGLNVFYNETLSMISNRNKSQPMFLYLAFQTVHVPLDVPPENEDDLKTCEPIRSVNQQRWVYCLKMQALDRAIGGIISHMKSEDMWDNTLGIFTTDNGGMVDVKIFNKFSENFTTSEGSNYPLRGGKATCFEGGVKGVGALFGGHQSVRAFQGTSQKPMFHAVDVPATFLSAANLPLPANYDGMDMLAVVGGSTPQRTVLPLHIQELGEENSGIRSGDWKLISGTPVYDGYFKPGQPTTYVQNCTRHCLFNITADPLETTDLSAKYPHVVAQLHALIDSIMKEGYKIEQTNEEHLEALPNKHDGVWAPWEN